MQTCDLLIIGGGINGVGIAADAAGRGLSVILCEKDDLAAATSSTSSKLIHGGLRYLEQFNFRLVHEALTEREILLKNAPHLVQPLEFDLPISKFTRPTWFIRAGLFLYDFLAKNSSLPKAKKISFQNQILKESFKIGFKYYDCKTDDARLVIANAQQAYLKGAKILTRTKFITAKRQAQEWQVELQNKNSEKFLITAKALVNAAGPWASDITHTLLNTKQKTLRLVKGSHIVVPKLYEGHQAYLLQNNDQRVIFVIPYLQQFSLIGTTDVEFNGDPNLAHISEEEINYLCTGVNYYFKNNINQTDVVWSYAGIRSLYDSGEAKPAKVTREYHFDIQDQNSHSPLLTVLGGKLTTYRALAEHALDKLKIYFPDMGSAWTGDAILPGGDLSKPLNEFKIVLQQQYPNLPKQLLERYANNYGNLSYKLLEGVKNIDDLGRDFGAGLYQKEVEYLIQQEWAETIEDILWRRTKLGLFLSDQQKMELANFICQFS